MTKVEWCVLVDGKSVFSGSVRTANVVFNALTDSFNMIKVSQPDFISPSVCFCKDIYNGGV